MLFLGLREGFSGQNHQKINFSQLINTNKKFCGATIGLPKVSSKQINLDLSIQYVVDPLICRF